METITRDSHPNLYLAVVEAWRFADFQHSGTHVSGGPFTQHQLRQMDAWLSMKARKHDLAEQTRAWCDGRQPSIIPTFSDAREIANGTDAGEDVALLLHQALSGDL